MQIIGVSDIAWQSTMNHPYLDYDHQQKTVNWALVNSFLLYYDVVNTTNGGAITILPTAQGLLGELVPHCHDLPLVSRRVGHRARARTGSPVLWRSKIHGDDSSPAYLNIYI